MDLSLWIAKSWTQLSMHTHTPLIPGLKLLLGKGEDKNKNKDPISLSRLWIPRAEVHL